MKVRLYTLFSLIILASQLNFGSGFQINEHGARSMGLAGAFTAIANNASAVYFNPAGITQLMGTHFSLGTTYISPSSKFTGPTGTLSTESELKKQYFTYFFLAIAVTGTFYTNKPNLDPGFPTPPISFVFKRAFWVLPPRNKDYHEMMSLIPSNTSVSAQTALLPHLSHRDKIYRFPDNYDSADYVLLAPTESPYPIDREKYEIIKEELLNNPNYEKIYKTYAGILFFKRR